MTHLLVLEGDSCNFTKSFKNLLNSAQYSDVKLAIGKERVLFHAHRCILGTRCESFNAMFAEVSVDREEAINIPDLQPEVFSTVMEFIYTNTCTLPSHEVIVLLSTAYELGIVELVKLCTVHIEQNLSIQTACQSMQAAVTFDLDTFKRSLLPFFREHTRSIFATSGFHELSEDSLAYVLRDDELTIEEHELVKCVENWTLVNSVALGRPASEVARQVVCNLRLPLLTPEELGHVERSNNKSRFIPVEQISMAWKHIALKTPFNSSLETTLRAGSKPRTS